MDFSVNASQLKNAGSADATSKASVNIKENISSGKNDKISSFSGILLSGMDIDQKKLDSNTYNSLLKEADDVKSQIMQSATDAKANLSALFKRLSGADMVKIDEDGFDLNDMSPDEMVSIVDKIKIELAAHGKKVYFAGASVTKEQIREVVGSEGLADSIDQKLESADLAGKISEKLSKAGLPVTPENAKDICQALSKAVQTDTISDAAKYYIVANNEDASIENVYKAQFKVSHNQPTDFSVFGTKKVSITEDEWQQLMPQAADIIRKSGAENNGFNVNDARKMLENDIPLSKENVKLMSELNNINIDYYKTDDGINELVEKITDNMLLGEKAEDTSLISQQTSLFKNVTDSINVLWTADIRHVAAVSKSGETFNIRNLENAINSIDKAAVHFNLNVNEGSDLSDMAAKSIQMQAANAVYADYEQLQQARILMTADAGMFLANKGVDLKTESIYNLVEQLKSYHQDMFVKSQLMTEDGTVTAVMEQENEQAAVNESQKIAAGLVSSFQTVLKVKRALQDIKYAPDVSIGAVAGEKEEGEKLTIADFAGKGNEYRRQYEQAGQAYQAVGTEVRKDLGDSINKAVDASYESILDELDLENNKANKDAVRISAQNNIEMTKENVENIKEINSTLQNIINNMKPEVTLNMIRENVDPMTADIHDVNKFVMDMKENLASDKEEKYSHFLYKLDKTEGISQEEKKQFIGIYKMMNIFIKDAGASIGTLVRNGQDITMENLITAYNSRKAEGLDYSVDDEANIPEISSKSNYYKELFNATGSKVTPLSLKTVNDNQKINEQSVESFCENITEAYDEEKEAQYYEEYIDEIKPDEKMEQRIYNELTLAQQEITVNNIFAMESIMNSGYFDTIFGTESGKMPLEKSERFLDDLEDREKLESDYDELYNECVDDYKTEVAGSDDQSYEDINMLRMRYKEIGLIRNLSKRHDYKIPVSDGKNIRMVNLTMIQDGSNAGRISVNFENDIYGKVSIEAKVDTDEVSLYAISEKESEQLSGKLENLSASLKENLGIEKTTINCQNISRVRRVTYEKSAEKIPEQELYKISKQIICSVCR